MGKLDTSISTLRSLYEVLGEERLLTGEHLCGRAYARHRLHLLAIALEEIDKGPRNYRYELTRNPRTILMDWVQRIGQPSASEQTVQGAYALQCAQVCYTEAQLMSETYVQKFLTDVGTVLIQFAHWLNAHPAGELNEV